MNGTVRCFPSPLHLPQSYLSQPYKTDPSIRDGVNKVPQLHFGRVVGADRNTTRLAWRLRDTSDA